MDVLMEALKCIAYLLVLVPAILWLWEVSMKHFFQPPKLPDEYYDYMDGPSLPSDVSHRVPRIERTTEQLRRDSLKLERDIEALRMQLRKDTYSDLAYTDEDGYR